MCQKLIFAALIITSAAFVLGLLLSLLKYTNIANLLDSRTIYYSTDVTLLVHRSFDLRYYDEVNVTITPQTNKQYLYNVFLCQVTCDEDKILTTLDINFPGRIDASNGDQTRDYIRFPDHEYPKVPGLFMLERSQISFKFTPVGATSFPNSTVNLYVFTDVTDCTDFRNGNDVEVPRRLLLTQEGGFKDTFTATTNDYICIIAEIPEGTIFNYTAIGSVLQYHNSSHLADSRLCETNQSIALETPSHDRGRTLTLKLSRPLRRTSSPTSQPSCVLIVVRDVDAPAYSVFETESVIFGTSSNVGVISLSVCAFLFLCMAGVFMLACAYVSC